MALKDRIAAAMRARGMSQAELSRATDMGSSKVSQILSGKVEDPRLSTVVLIAKALGVSVDYLAGIDSPPPLPTYLDPRQRKLNEDYSELSDVGRESAVGTVAALLSVERARVSEPVPSDVSEAV